LALAACGSVAPSAAQDDARVVNPIPADAQIIFVSGRDRERDPWGMDANALYAGTLDGKVTRITTAKFSHNHFVVSPDRRYIATNRYSRGDNNKDGKYFPLNDYKELWLLDTVAGTEKRLIPEIDAGWGGLSWSPDSKWIYFSSPTPDVGMDLRRVNIETDRVEVLTADVNRLLGVHGARKFVSDVGVSHDGHWLVFLYSRPAQESGGNVKTRIAVMKTDGSEAHFVTDGGPLPPGRRGVWSVGDFDPEFSPDGKSISFARVTDVGMVSATLSTFDILTVGVDGSGLRTISPPRNAAAEFIPGWGDNGKLIFTRLDPAARSMAPVVYDPVTGSRTPVSIGGEGSHVQWIPSGR
jgi:Tol biopolymer transport system component